MRIGIDFDNTIICYDEVFRHLAIAWQLLDKTDQGSKRQLRDKIRLLSDGELLWQRMQGQVYGAQIHQANLFDGFKEFVAMCNNHPQVEIYIVSHKTEFGHFDESRVNLRDAARRWLSDQGFFNSGDTHIREANIFFETTREDKINRIKALQCTHFIDDLVEVLDSPLFPAGVERFLFQPKIDPQLVDTVIPRTLLARDPAPFEDAGSRPKTCRDDDNFQNKYLKHYSSWTEIKNAIFRS
jgi:hypothetical protein